MAATHATSTASLMAANASPEEMRRALCEQAIFAERSLQTLKAHNVRITDLETCQREQNGLVIARLEALAKSVDRVEDGLLVLQTTRAATRDWWSRAAYVAATLAGLVFAAKQAGFF